MDGLIIACVDTSDIWYIVVPMPVYGYQYAGMVLFGCFREETRKHKRKTEKKKVPSWLFDLFLSAALFLRCLFILANTTTLLYVGYSGKLACPFVF